MLQPVILRPSLAVLRGNFRAAGRSSLQQWRRPLTINSKRLASAPVVFTPEEIRASEDQRLKALSPYVSKLPKKWIPYAELMRLQNPTGTWLLFIPGTWAIGIAGFTVAAPLAQTVGVLSAFAVGSLIMRGAGCTINDIHDRDLDNKVARTISRPLASGRVLLANAYAFLGAQVFTGGLVLLTLPWDCFVLGAASLLPVMTYPLFKRFTYYPQVVLSLCFDWAALLGFAAMGVWNWQLMIPLYVLAFSWCMIYDTIYAHQDKKFDIHAGIKSTALKWGQNTKPICYGFATVQIGCLAFVGASAAMGPGFWLAGTWFSYRVVEMIRSTNLDSPQDCWKAFRKNVTTGKILAGGVFIDYFLRLLGFL